MGRGGQVVILFAFYSNDLISNPSEVYNLTVKNAVEKNQNKQNETGFGQFLSHQLYSSKGPN